MALALALWAFVIEPRRLVRVDVRLGAPVWPPTPRLRVGLVSDLHVGAPGVGPETVGRVVDALNEAEPDLVLLLGDFSINGIVGGAPVEPAVWAAELRALRPRLGSFAVLGNHDWWNDAAAVRAALATAGVRTLENEAERLIVGGEELWLVGIGDEMTSHDRIDEALAGVPTGAPLLAMTHGPDLFDRLPARVPLLLAGHTHGGQVRLPGFAPTVVPSRYGARFARGLVTEGGRSVYVTSGVGTSILPARWNVPPEVVVLELGEGP